MKTNNENTVAVLVILVVLILFSQSSKDDPTPGRPPLVSELVHIEEQAMQRQRESEEAIRQSKLAADERYKIDMARLRESQRAVYYATKEEP